MQISKDTPRLGLGCWPLSGPFYQGTRALGYANADPAESLRALDAAYANGIRIFDTAAVYGAGKGERLVGKSIAQKSDTIIISKIGLAFEETSEQLIGPDSDPANIMPAIDACLARLNSDHIDLMLLHQNELPINDAAPLFDAMETARKAGKIGAFGWSTDFPNSVAAMAPMDGFSAVEHAMHVFLPAGAVRKEIKNNGLVSLVRSPLAMGLLSGKYDATRKLAADDVRTGDEDYNDYYVNGRANPKYLDQIATVRDSLQTGGRSLVQGALCWIMAAGDDAIPLPGARTVAQVEENAKALAHGPLPEQIMMDIEAVLVRPSETQARAR
jgi:aryl-alcohol dehydrogenase-like predicted oxidoreductase